MTGSVLLPFKALIMNALSICAALGIVVLIFQDGRLEDLFSYTSSGTIESSAVLLVVAIAFGLSTDYGVFLLGRIKEAYDAGAANKASVAIGLQRTGRIVTFAALLFCVAMGSMVAARNVVIKETGVAVALAVAIDATIVRALLVPSLMALLGEWNWWAPGPLRRIHDRYGPGEAGSGRDRRSR
jgi:RND superfamily putative drug exporter